MQIRFIVCPICCALFSLVLHGNSLSWDNEVTHKDLAEIAAQNSVLNAKDDYLKNLGFNKGLKEVFRWNKQQAITDWFREGSNLEDAGNKVDLFLKRARSYNHFHNPLKQWDQAGLNDSYTVPIPYWPYVSTYSMVGESALLWAQDQTYQAQYTTLEADQSWQKIRDHYYDALTSTTNVKRQAEFAQTFKGLGHQMHLLQDMAVPAHVRNDAHVGEAVDDWLVKHNRPPVDLHFETWAKKNADKIKQFGSQPELPQIDFLRNPGGKIPITQLYDTDQYTENFVPSTSPTWGLSEYTNANFVSDDTIFTEQFKKDDRHYFPYPRYTGNTQCYEQYEEPYLLTNKMRKYWRKKAGGCAGEAVNHFVNVGSLFGYWPTWDLQRLSINLDNATNNDYSEKLVPRAVGYSAGLLNYFFRGDIRLEYTTSPRPGYVIVNKTDENMSGLFQILYDNNKDQRVKYMDGNFSLGKQSRGDVFDLTAPADAKEPGRYILAFKGNMGNEKGAVAGYVTTRLLEITPPDQFIYAMINDSANDPYFRSIRVKVKNASPSEQMKTGTILAVAKYKSDTYDAGFIYSMSDPQAIDLSSNAAVKVVFDFDNDPIPVDVTDLYLEIVFKGTIGNEANATASGVRDIREPTPIDVFNDTDKSCISGSWYSTADAVDLMDTSSPKDQIADTWDVNPHILQDIYVKVSSMGNPQKASPSVYNAVVPNLNPGEFKRAMYILTDEYFKYSFYSTWSPSPTYTDRWPQSDKEHTYNGTAVKNQTDYSSDSADCGKDPWCYIYRYPAYYSLRGNDMWWGGGVVYINWPYPADSSCQGY